MYINQFVSENSIKELNISLIEMLQIVILKINIFFCHLNNFNEVLFEKK